MTLDLDMAVSEKIFNTKGAEETFKEGMIFGRGLEHLSEPSQGITGF